MFRNKYRKSKSYVASDRSNITFLVNALQMRISTNCNVIKYYPLLVISDIAPTLSSSKIWPKLKNCNFWVVFLKSLTLTDTYLYICMT